MSRFLQILIVGRVWDTGEQKARHATVFTDDR